MKNKRIWVLAVGGVALIALAAFGARRMAWDWTAIGNQLRHASLLHLLLATACIYAGMPLRAGRWALLMRGQKFARWQALVSPQLIGFAAVGLFGRLADLTRPALIARRTDTTIAAQVGVYSLERMFDLAAAAVLFSITLLFAPHSMPHHQAIVRAGILASAGTAILLIAAISIRLAGSRIAALAARILQPISPHAAQFAAERILEFRHGLQNAGSAAALGLAGLLSLAIWTGIAAAYVFTVRAFPHAPALASLSIAQVMLLMATSMGSSLLQVPVLGWFTQIGLVATAMHTLLDIPIPASLACGTALLVVTLLVMIPVGLVAAQVAGVSLRTTPDAG